MKKILCDNWLFRIEIEDQKFGFFSIADYIITTLLRLSFLWFGIQMIQNGLLYGVLLFLPLIIGNFSFEFIREWKWKDTPIMKLYRKFKGGF